MTISKTVGNGMEEARDALNHAGERIEESTREARKAASEKLHGAAAAGRQHAGEAYDTAERLARSAGRYARDNPGQAILIGLGGLLLASMLFRRR
jgi:ElaB/YqjD/DUF883 family membrane-anchored ribosome-binding protein